MRRRHIGIGFVLLAAVALSRGETENVVLTPRDMRKQGIVTLVGKTIEIKASVMWEYASVTIPEDPRSMEMIAQQAGALKVSFNIPGFEDIASRKYFLATGEKPKKVVGSDGREGYTIGVTPLINGKEYILKVRVEFRPSFNAQMLDNPAFVKQSNDPRYWSQTFALDILDVR